MTLAGLLRLPRRVAALLSSGDERLRQMAAQLRAIGKTTAEIDRRTRAMWSSITRSTSCTWTAKT